MKIHLFRTLKFCIQNSLGIFLFSVGMLVSIVSVEDLPGEIVGSVFSLTMSVLMDYRGLWFWYRKLSLVYTCVHTHLFLCIKYLNQKGWPDVKARLRTRYLFFQKSFSCYWKYHRRTEVSVLYHSLFHHFIHLIFYCLLWQQPLEGFSLTVKQSTLSNLQNNSGILEEYPEVETDVCGVVILLLYSLWCWNCFLSEISQNSCIPFSCCVVELILPLSSPEARLNSKLMRRVTQLLWEVLSIEHSLPAVLCIFESEPERRWATVLLSHIRMLFAMKTRHQEICFVKSLCIYVKCTDWGKRGMFLSRVRTADLRLSN